MNSCCEFIDFQIITIIKFPMEMVGESAAFSGVVAC